tara:strand:+ start:536 stop:1276 length:741 start_codon:yes stop_codon:yes gene_type:complete
MECKKKQITELIKNKNIPNILFYGPFLEGKEDLCKYFLNLLYPNKENYNKFVLRVNCLYTNGIQTMKNDIKLFAMQIIRKEKDLSFKTIVLEYAENLTYDSQYCLRRTIEQYSNHTRFIILCENKHKLLQPICSRFVQIYVNLNYHKKNFYLYDTFRYNKYNQFMKEYNSILENNQFKQLFPLAKKMYMNHFFSLEILYKFKQNPKYNIINLSFENYRKTVRNEILCIFYILSVFRNKSNIQICSL